MSQQHSTAYNVGKYATRGLVDVLAGIGGFLVGGPAGAVAAVEVADTVVKTGFEIGEDIYEAVNPEELPTHVKASQPRIQTNNAANLLPVKMGKEMANGNIYVPKQQPNAPLQSQIPISASRIGETPIIPIAGLGQPVVNEWHHRFHAPIEPVIKVGLAKPKNEGRRFISDQNVNPNAGFGTTGFTKLRNPNGDPVRIKSIMV